MAPRITAEERARILRMKEDGWSHNKIAAATGRHLDTIRYTIKRAQAAKGNWNVDNDDKL